MALTPRCWITIQYAIFNSAKRSRILSSNTAWYRCTQLFSTQVSQGTTNTTELSLRAVFLAETFGTCKSKMETFLKSNGHIVAMSHNKFHSCSHLLKQYGVTVQDVLAHPDIYRYSIFKLQTQLKELQSRGLDIYLTRVALPADVFEKRVAKLTVNSEIENEYESIEGLLTTLLECSPMRAQSLIKTHGWLKNSRLVTLKTNIETIKVYGVTNEAILCRLFVIVCSQDILEYQLSTLRKNGIRFSDYSDKFVSFLQPVNRKFEKILARILAERQILEASNCKNKQDYILQRLNATKDDLDGMVQQSRHLLSMNVPKLKQNLDLLLDTCQIPPGDIISHAHVLAFANSTLLERSMELNALGIAVSPAHLKLPGKKFRKVVEQLSGKQI